jgi:site-specific DNA recombinase
MLYIKAAMAEAEIEKMRARMRRKNLERAENGGRHPGGFRALGTVGAGKRRVSEAQARAEQELIAEAAQRIIDGDSLRGIATDWNKRELRTPTGGSWSNVTLRTMLLSPRAWSASDSTTASCTPQRGSRSCQGSSGRP